MKKKNFWLSYDCDGSDPNNYKELYIWLESHQAQECGNSVAFIRDYEYEEDFITELTTDLNAIPHVERLYVCSKEEDGDQFFGRFLKGSRKINPWNGSVKS